MKNSKKLKILTVFAVTLFLVNCQNDNIEEIGDRTQETIPDEILKNLQNMGFSTTDIPVIKDKEGYIVEGDIFIPTEEILGHTTKQRYVRVMTCRRARNVRVRNNLSGVFRRQVANAIRNWNNVNGSFLRLVQVNSGSADITISFDRGELPSGTAGRGQYPSNGRAGTFSIINRDFFNGRPNRTAAIRSTIEHELGHNIGLAHTNSSVGRIVPGVGSRDNASLMNGGRAGSVRRLSTRDKRALRKLYGPGNNVCR